MRDIQTLKRTLPRKVSWSPRATRSRFGELTIGQYVLRGMLFSWCPHWLFPSCVITGAFSFSSVVPDKLDAIYAFIHSFRLSMGYKQEQLDF